MKKRINKPDHTARNTRKTRRDIADGQAALATIRRRITAVDTLATQRILRLEQRIAALERLHDGLDGAA